MDALRRASAASITAVVPYYAYARQDRKTAPRVPISAKLVANLLTTAGTHRLLTMDLHTGQIQGFFDIPVDHLYAAPVMLDYIRENFPGELVMVSPDAGGVERARAFAKRLNATLAIIDKRREATVIKAMTLVGNVFGKEAIILDDMVTTGATLTTAAEVLMQHGAKSVHACVTHPVMSRNAVSAVKSSLVQSLAVTDTIPLSPEAAALEKIRVLSVAPLLGEAATRFLGRGETAVPDDVPDLEDYAIFYHRRSDGRGAIDTFLDRRGHTLSDQERHIYERFRDSICGYFEVKEVWPGKGFRLSAPYVVLRT